MNRLPVTRSLAAVAVDVDERRRVALRPRVVDRPPRPLAVLALFEPKHPVVVACGRHDIVPAVSVHVHNVHEAQLEHTREWGAVLRLAPALERARGRRQRAAGRQRCAR